MNRKLLISVLSMIMLGTFSLFAQAQTSYVPLSISVASGFGVAPTNPSFNVALTVDKDPTAQGTAVYAINEAMAITTRPDIASYIYLFNIRATGEIDTILPNNFENVDYTGAGQAKIFPTASRGYEFRVAGAQGRSYILAVATQQPLAAQIIQQIDAQVASSSTDIYGQTMLNLNFPNIQQAWAISAMPFVVGQPVVVPPVYVPPVYVPPVNQFGTLHIQTNIIGGRVIINNQQAGVTDNLGKLDLSNLPVGTHSIRIEAPAAGFMTYFGQFTIQPNQQSDVLVAF